MGMTIYVQKLSIPAEEWSLDVESSDLVESVKQKLKDQEAPASYDLNRIKLFFNGQELQNNNTLSDYNIQKFSNITSSYQANAVRTVIYM
jgi:hypothetical protein